MQMRRASSVWAGGSCAVLLGLVAVVGTVGLPAVGFPAVEVPAVEVTAAGSPAGPPVVARSGTAGLLLVRPGGPRPVTLATPHLAGPALRAWWPDAVGDRTVDAGAVRRDPALTLVPPDTGDGRPHDWTLVVVDATRGLVPVA